MAREHRRVASPRTEKVETKGKEKERKVNVSTNSVNLQWASGSWEQQSWQTEADSANWREDDWFTAEPGSQASAAAEEFQHESFGELRLSSESFQRDRLDASQRTITFGIDTAACTTVVLAHHRGGRVLDSPRFLPRMCVQDCRQRQSVRPRKENFVHLGWIRKASGH